MEILAKGFSGKILIQIQKTDSEGKPVRDYYSGLMTSYQIGINSNVLKSQGAFPLYNLSSSSSSFSFSRIAMQGIRDHINYELSVSLELNEDLFDFLILELKEYFSNPKYNLIFMDKYLNLRLIFNKCFISNFVLSVQQQGITTANLTFVYYKQTFNVEDIEDEFKNYYPEDIEKIIDDESKEDKVKNKVKNEYEEEYNIIDKVKGNNLMPYYHWGIYKKVQIKESDGTFFDTFIQFNNLMNFTLTFARTITPKYGCTGKAKEVHAIQPIAVVLSVPTITYDLTFLLLEGNKLSDYDNYNYKEDYEKVLDKYDLKFSYQGKNNIKEFTLTKCYNDTYTPNIGSKNENTISISGSVYGLLTQP